MMPTINLGRLPGTSLNRPVIEVLTGATADKQIVSAQLNAALKSELTSSAKSSEQTALANLLETLAPADLAADQNLSLRDFVAKHTPPPTDPVRVLEPFHRLPLRCIQTLAVGGFSKYSRRCRRADTRFAEPRLQKNKRASLDRRAGVRNV
jgi:hypothetical protein